MSYRTALLEQCEPLEPHEVEDLRRCLRVLEADCEAFGETAEDRRRMHAIRRRLAELEPGGTA